MEQVIKEHPAWKLLSKAKLTKKVRDEYDIPVKEIHAWHDARELAQVYARPPAIDKAHQLKITAPPYSFQIDVVFLKGFKSQNNNVTQFLLIVDIVSRKAFAYALKSGKMRDVLDVYEQFIVGVSDVNVNSVAGDNFFNNAEFIEFNAYMGINVYTDVAKDDHIVRGRGDKLGIVDRCVRTLKQMINKYMDEHNTVKWTQFLPEIVDEYNDSPHDGLRGNSPNEVYDDEDYAQGLYEAQAEHNRKTFDKFKFDIGDHVRVLQGKGVFDKEGAKYSKEIYTIAEQDGYRFVLLDEDGEKVRRKYRPNELQEVKIVGNRIRNNIRKQTIEKHKKVLRTQRALPQIEYNDAEKEIDEHAAKKKVVQRGVQRNVDRKTRSGKRT